MDTILTTSAENAIFYQTLGDFVINAQPESLISTQDVMRHLLQRLTVGPGAPGESNLTRSLSRILEDDAVPLIILRGPTVEQRNLILRLPAPVDAPRVVEPPVAAPVAALAARVVAPVARVVAAPAAPAPAHGLVNRPSRFIAPLRHLMEESTSIDNLRTSRNTLYSIAQDRYDHFIANNTSMLEVGPNRAQAFRTFFNIEVVHGRRPRSSRYVILIRILELYAAAYGLTSSEWNNLMGQPGTRSGLDRLRARL